MLNVQRMTIGQRFQGREPAAVIPAAGKGLSADAC